MNRFLTTTIIGAIALTCGLSQAQITIDASRDTGIFGAGFDGNGVPSFTSRNLGGHTHAPVGRANSDRVNRGLFDFDIVGSLPAGATVASAVFEFEVTQQGGIQGTGGDDFDLHVITTAWVEGTGVGNIGEDTFDGASWASTDGTATWTNLGGDFNATPLGSVNVVGPDGTNGEAPIVFQITSPALADYVQDVVDGAVTNNGLLLKTATEAVFGSASRVTTIEGGNAAKLIVTVEDDMIMIGDVNMDGAVNLLDIGPFVDLISTNTFQAEADINGDGAVNLLDVGPFVDILAGG